MPISPLPKNLPSTLPEIKTLIDERVAERDKLESDKAPIQANINKINQEIEDLRIEIDVILKLRDRPVKKDRITGAIIP